MAQSATAAASTSNSNAELPSLSNKSQENATNQIQLPAFRGFTLLSNGDFQMSSSMYPVFVPGLNSLQPIQEQLNHGAGLYAVPVFQNMGPVAGVPFNTLVPFSYNIPSAPAIPDGAGAVGEEQRQVVQQQQQPAQQRQVVRRFQIEFRLDLLLILKLAALVFLFSQDGSWQRLTLLVFSASLIYLYQTGVFAPLIRWVSRKMQRAAATPQQPRPVVRAENMHAARQEDENAAAGEHPEPGPHAENGAVQHEGMEEPGAADNVNGWWRIVKEIQVIVFGFIASLLPGFHNMD